MEGNDVSVQLYSFLEVTAVRYDEKFDKDGQSCDIRDIVIRRNVPGGPIDCTIHVPKKLNFKPFPSKVSASVYSETLKHIFKTYLRSDMK